MKDGRAFAFAGLWEGWHGGDDMPVETCAILTTTANDLVRPVHDRMPVIITPGDFAAWLDPRTPAAEVGSLLRPYPAEEMAVGPVACYVSNPRNEGPRCLSPRPGTGLLGGPARQQVATGGLLDCSVARGRPAVRGRRVRSRPVTLRHFPLDEARLTERQPFPAPWCLRRPQDRDFGPRRSRKVQRTAAFPDTERQVRDVLTGQESLQVIGQSIGTGISPLRVRNEDTSGR